MYIVCEAGYSPPKTESSESSARPVTRRRRRKVASLPRRSGSLARRRLLSVSGAGAQVKPGRTDDRVDKTWGDVVEQRLIVHLLARHLCARSVRLTRDQRTERRRHGRRPHDARGRLRYRRAGRSRRCLRREWLRDGRQVGLRERKVSHKLVAALCQRGALEIDARLGQHVDGLPFALYSVPF